MIKDAVHRLAAPVLNRIPDISQQPVRRQAAIGVTASILVHLLLLLILSIAAMVIPSHTEPAPAARNDLEIQLVPLPEKKQVIAEKKPDALPLIDPRGMEKSQEKPKSAEFESDRDMKAGSELPANGLLPLPSQEGRTDRNTNDFATQDVRISLTEPAITPTPPSPQPSPQEAAPAPSMPPLYDPNPVAKEKIAAAEHAKPTDKLPEPAKPRATPPPMKTTMMPREDEMAVAKPVATPPPGPVTKVEPVSKPAPKFSVASLVTPKPMTAPSFAERYQENLQKTRIEGAISNRGKAGVDAVASPLGRYWSQVKQALNSSWTPLVKDRMSLIAPGSASFVFSISSDGKVVGVHMESNSSNSTFGSLCEEAIRKAPIPQPPADLVPSLRDGALEYNMTFTFYDF